MTPLAPAPVRTALAPVLPEAWSKWFRDVAALLGFDNNHSRILTPTLTGLAVVGTVAQSLVYVKQGNVISYQVILAPSGGGTVAATAGTTRVDSLPYKASHDAGGMVINAVSLALLGAARVDAGTKQLYLPTFAATANKVIVSGWYRTEE
jgi:hypothetical protein